MMSNEVLLLTTSCVLEANDHTIYSSSAGTVEGEVATDTINCHHRPVLVVTFVCRRLSLARVAVAVGRSSLLEPAACM